MLFFSKNGKNVKIQNIFIDKNITSKMRKIGGGGAFKIAIV